MTKTPNVAAQPNVMLALASQAEEITFLSGDLAHLIYGRLLMGRTELIAKVLTGEQYVEYLQYLPCARCHRPCAGTCSREVGT